MNTQSGRILFAAGLITAALTSGAIGQQDEKLGKVAFPTSCDPNVQAEFDRGVAMLHSYWFLIARRKFEGILQQDPTCAMAYWGVAMDYLGNTLATTPTRADSQAAWEALEKARAAGAKTQRERDWIEALSAYFRDHDKVAVGTRLAACRKRNCLGAALCRHCAGRAARAAHAVAHLLHGRTLGRIHRLERIGA